MADSNSNGGVSLVSNKLICLPDEVNCSPDKVTEPPASKSGCVLNFVTEGQNAFQISKANNPEIDGDYVWDEESSTWVNGTKFVRRVGLNSFELVDTVTSMVFAQSAAPGDEPWSADWEEPNGVVTMWVRRMCIVTCLQVWDPSVCNWCEFEVGGDRCADKATLAMTVVARAQFVDFTLPADYSIEHVKGWTVQRLVPTANELEVADHRMVAGLLRIELDGSPNADDTHRVLLHIDKSCPLVDMGQGGGNYDEGEEPTVVNSTCIGSIRVDEMSDGSLRTSEDVACVPQPGLVCAGQLTIDIVPGVRYYFRNTGGVTLDGLIPKGSPLFDDVKGPGTGTQLESYAGDPRIPLSLGGDDSPVLYYPQEAGFLAFPEHWAEVANPPGPNVDQGATVIGEWFVIASQSTASIPLPPGIDYYATTPAVTDPDDPLTYSSLPWNTTQPESAPEATCA